MDGREAENFGLDGREEEYQMSFEQNWELNILRVNNGYILTGKFGNSECIEKVVLEDKADDPLAAHESLLWEIMEYFAFQGSKHDPERLFIVRRKKDAN